MDPLIGRLVDDFEKYRAALVAEGSSGQHAVITADGLFGTFATFAEAYDSAARTHRPGTFAIKEVQSVDRVEIFSRLLAV